MLHIIKRSPVVEILSNLHFWFNRLIGNFQVKGNDSKIIISKGTLLWKCKIIIKGTNNTITFGKNSTFRNVTFRITGNNCNIVIDEKVKFYDSGYFLIEGDNGKISIGEKTTFGSAKIFLGEGNTSIEIGKDCMFSRDISMNTSDFHSILDSTTMKRVNPPKSIIVGDHIWVGNNATIAKGAEINSDCIIAAKAHVTGKIYEPNSIIGGIPAKELKSGITWSREKLPY